MFVLETQRFGYPPADALAHLWAQAMSGNLR